LIPRSFEPLMRDVLHAHLRVDLFFSVLGGMQ
jgi:hypothetical protein